MAIEIKLPVLGEGVDSGTVAGVLTAPGDTVAADAPLIELETDKAVIEVPATESGVVASLSVKAGDTVAVGQVIATIEPGAEPGGEPAARVPKPTSRKRFNPWSESGPRIDKEDQNNENETEGHDFFGGGAFEPAVGVLGRRPGTGQNRS